jgi:ABC-type antimicrobial peptide transport system permease subunit
MMSIYMASFFKKISESVSAIVGMATFSMLLVLYVVFKGFGWISRRRFFPKFVRVVLRRPFSYMYILALRVLGSHREGSISRVALIELSIRNMRAKKTRTLITVGGMAVGIGTIVFLVSIGYGLQQLVITRVARLEEMRQFDISPQPGGKVKIDDKTIADLGDISEVEAILPLISVVGRVNYNDSASDMAVYGVTSEYLKRSAIQPVVGDIFESDEISSQRIGIEKRTEGSVDAGSIMAFDEKIRDADFSISASSWVRVRETPKTDSKVIGFTKGNGRGEEHWGSGYDSTDEVGKSGIAADGTVLGKWMKADVLLWEERLCDTVTQGDCEDGKHMVLRDKAGEQVRSTGYFGEIGVEVFATGSVPPAVLGESADTTFDSPDWVSIESESDAVAMPDATTVELPKDARRQAVVNRSALKVLGIVDERDAVGKSFSVAFVVVGDLLSDPTRKVESVPAEYVIVGVTPDEKSPVFYVPFIDLRSLGITNYSQIKTVVRAQSALSDVRKRVEASGYVTRSVADTVAQISSLFASARIALGVLGMTALAVSALGMFNTLTISLLERTREVGLMKAMGMKSYEVRELFLTESMIMGIFGGMFGLLGGYLLGKLVGLIFSFFSLSAGFGFVDVSFIPALFAFVILILSLIVGLGTGVYPANRSTRISALDALRYE